MEEIQNSPTRVYKAYFSGIFGVLASTLLVALSCLNAWNARLAPGDAEKPLRAVAVVEMTHAISCYILLFPLIQDCICRSQLRPMAIQMSRGAGFVLSLTGISLILASLPYDRSDLYPPASGLMILVLSCISLMTSYWPDRGEDSYRTAAMRDAPPPLDTGIVDSTPLLTEEGTNDGLSDIEQGSTDCGRADDTATESGCNECPLPAELFEGTDFDRQYQLGKELGSGAFSIVVEGMDRTTKDSYAVKIVTKSNLSPEHEKALKNEISVLSELNHPNIIRLFHVFDEKDHYFMVTEKLEGGELFDRIELKSQYNEKEARETALVLFQAIQYCHDHKIAHRDLKPENLLLKSNADDSNIKIADFGFARKCPRPCCLQTQCGTPAYVAPEILEHRFYDTRVDMWSLGVVIYILLGGYPPFYEQSARELYRKIRKGAFQFHTVYWGRISKDAKDLIRSLLVVDPAKRISAADALENSWIKKSDAELQDLDLSSSLTEFKKFNAKRKMKAAVQAVLATQKLPSMGLLESPSR